MVIADIINMVRLKINDKDSVEFTDSELLSFVNDGIRFIREIYMDEMPDMLAKVGTADLNSGENSFELPQKLLKITDIRCDGKRLNYVQIKEVANLEDTGVPEYYAVTFESVTVFPIPNKPSTISYRYILESPMYDYLDEFPFPIDFVQYAQEYAVIRAGAVIGADMSVETQVFGQLRGDIVNAIQGLLPNVEFVDGYYY